MNSDDVVKNMKKKPDKIAIVGAGPVGSLLSIYLARRGYAITVFERRADLRIDDTNGGRSINLALSNRGLRALQEVGLAAQIKAHAIPMNGRQMHDPLGHLTFLPYGKQGQFIHSISRSGLNSGLIAEAEKLGVKFLFEHRCLGVDLEKTELTLQMSGTTVHYPADFIIGSDGAFSSVRGAMQLSDRFDYSQDYIEHGYKELHLPPGENGAFRMEKNALHIWPRESFMLIALPNPDGSFTCTLFSPLEGELSFSQWQKPDAFESFFKKSFPDVHPWMPSLIQDFLQNPTASLVTVRCHPWVKNNTLLIGDAAHGIVPFFGQGMNAGFEDCRILHGLLEHLDDRWDIALPEFQQLRKPDTDAIAQLALDNFVEMRDLVADADFLLRKKIEAKLHELFPEKWIPLYSMVTFDDRLRYSEAQAAGRKQKEIMDRVMRMPDIASTWESIDFREIVKLFSGS